MGSTASQVDGYHSANMKATLTDISVHYYWRVNKSSDTHQAKNSDGNQFSAREIVMKARKSCNRIYKYILHEEN